MKECFGGVFPPVIPTCPLDFVVEFEGSYLFVMDGIISYITIV